MVERDLAKVDVAGSTPVSRSKFFKGRLGWRFLLVPTQGRMAYDGLFMRITLS